MKLSTLKVNIDNPRKFSVEKVKKMSELIEKYPFMMNLRPIIVDKDNVIIGGNLRYNALVYLGYDEVPDNWVKKAEELSESDRKAFIVLDNHQLGEWEGTTLSLHYSEIAIECGLLTLDFDDDFFDNPQPEESMKTKNGTDEIKSMPKDDLVLCPKCGFKFKIE